MMYLRKVEGPNANLGLVRDKLTDDLQATAQDAVNCGHAAIKSLASKYAQKSAAESKELQGVVNTAETQTRWLLDSQMRASLEKNGIGDFARLKERLTSLFIILPAGTKLETHAVWFRLIVTCILNRLYEVGAEEGEGGIPVMMMLSEFAQMANLPPIKAAFGQVRKYGVRLWPVLQNYSQAVSIYGPNDTKTFLANSGCTIGLRPNDDMTANFMSEFSGHIWKMTTSARDNPQGGRPDITIGMTNEPVWTADRIRELPKFHGLVWFGGQSQPQPVYLPPYWDIPECRAVARPDPFYPQAQASGSHFRRNAGAVVTAAAVGAAAAHAGVSLHSWLAMLLR
jgi:type IV secretory pathway TraG/TraD family ATPase VirD4